MNNVNSAAFESEELLICSALGEALDSLHACYVDDFNCDQDYRVTAYIVIDAELNYLDKRVTQTLIRNELINYDGRLLEMIRIFEVPATKYRNENIDEKGSKCWKKIPEVVNIFTVAIIAVVFFVPDGSEFLL